ncbi:DUF5686 family protein [Myroides sp. LJL119]
MGKYFNYFLCLLAVLLLQSNGFAQQVKVSGYISNQDNLPVVKARVFIKNTNLQTQTDSLGYYFFNQAPLKGTITVQSPDYLTKRSEYNAKEQIQIDLSFVISPYKKGLFSFKNPQDDYALFILDLVRKNGYAKRYTLDYYSKGNIQLASQRKTFLGQARKDLDSSLDLALNSPYVYLGELSSKITVLNSNYVKEQVEAQREFGQNKDLFFQTGIDSHLDFYQKRVSNQLKIISPLANYAQNYYNFKITAIQKDTLGHDIYHISFFPKREREPVLTGEMTISSDLWQLNYLYASMKGNNVGLPAVNQLVVVQNFAYSPTLDRYIKKQQNLYIKGKFIVFDFTGQYNSFYSEHQRDKTLNKSDFSNELISYKPNFNNYNPSYWDSIRPVTLRDNESIKLNDILSVDNAKTVKVLDSIDKRVNNVTLFKFIKGYKYINSSKQTSYTYRGLLSTFAFNAVQGFNVTTGLDFSKVYQDQRQTDLGAILNFGVSENKTRFSGYASHLFNRINYNKITLSGGAAILQFNQDAPIKTPINSFASAWFGKNYAKFYQNDFIRLEYQQYVFTRFKFQGFLEYASRRNLKNHIETPPFAPNLRFSSNNPLDPKDYQNDAFINNKSFKLNMKLDLVFDQKIISYPQQKQYLPVSRYPVVSLLLEKALNSTTSNYNYTFVSLSTTFNNNIGIYGDLFVGLSAGWFLEKNPIAFTDYKHFNGNQTFVGSTPVYNKQFNLLPYYSYSTNRDFIELHIEHDFRGYLINKIPLLNKTGYSFVVGFHMLEVPEKDVYQEFSVGLNNIGFKKFRPFRLDYFTSISPDSPKKWGIILGIKVLDMIQK